MRGACKPALLIGAVLALGCVDLGRFQLEIVIPDDAREEAVELTVYALGAPEGMASPCREVQAAGGEVSPSFSIQASARFDLPLTAQQAGIEGVPTGRVVFYALARNAAGQAILRGCTEAAISAEQDARVVIQLDWACRGLGLELCDNGLDDDCDDLTDEIPCSDCQLDADCEAFAEANGLALPACTRWACVDGRCEPEIDPWLDGQPCDDEDPCTVGDRCTLGVCQGADLGCFWCESAGDCDVMAPYRPCVSAWDCVGGRCEPLVIAGDGAVCANTTNRCFAPEGVCQEGFCLLDPVDCSVGTDCLRVLGCSMDAGCRYEAEPNYDLDWDGFFSQERCGETCDEYPTACAGCDNCRFSDCDDADSDVNPAMPELCRDGVDNDCDGQTDEACRGWSGLMTGCAELEIAVGYPSNSAFNLAIGDADLDGVADLLLADAGVGTSPEPFLGLAMGGVQGGCWLADQELELPSSYRPIVSRLLDLDRDGRAEIALLDMATGCDLVLLGSDGAELAFEEDIQSCTPDSALLAAEIDGAGLGDLIVARKGTSDYFSVDAIEVARVGGALAVDRVFGSSLSLDQIKALGIGAGDFDGDGLDEPLLLVRANIGSDYIYRLAVFRNQGGSWNRHNMDLGSFSIAGDHTPCSLAVLDFDEDGRDDAALLWQHIEGQTMSARLTVLRSLGGEDPMGWFAESEQVSAADVSATGNLFYSFELQAADVDADGLDDLVVLDRVANRSHIYLNNGHAVDRHFLSPHHSPLAFPQDVQIRELLIGELTGEPPVDVLYVSENARAPYESYARQQSGAGATPSPVQRFKALPGYLLPLLPLTDSLTRGLAADFDRDGLGDLVLLAGNAYALLRAQPAPGSRIWTGHVEQEGMDLIGPGVPDRAYLLEGYLDRDRDRDFLLVCVDHQGATRTHAYVYRPDSAQFVHAETSAQSEQAALAALQAKLDADPVPDLVLVEQGMLRVFKGVPGTAIAFDHVPMGTQLLSPAIAQGPAALLDRDLDGYPELALSIWESGEHHVLVLGRPGPDAWTFVQELFRLPGQSPDAIGTADVNADRIPDLVLAEGSRVRITTDLSTVEDLALASSLGAIEQVLACDLDGDHLLDDLLLVSTERILAVDLAVEEGAVIAAREIPIEVSADHVQVGDLDADGRMDVWVLAGGQVQLFVGQAD